MNYEGLSHAELLKLCRAKDKAIESLAARIATFDTIVESEGLEDESRG